jgi:hypothetical protein
VAGRLSDVVEGRERTAGGELAEVLLDELLRLGTKSPTRVRVQLSGRYQVVKNSRTSSSVAAARSSIEPMVGQWYGYSGS